MRYNPTEPYIFQANFPASQAGKLADIYYTVYNADGTVFLSKRQTSIVEQGLGIYNVTLAFATTGRYSILWEITGYPNPASHEINILDEVSNTYRMLPGG